MVPRYDRTDSLVEFRALVQAGVADGFESWYGPLISRRFSYILAWVVVRYTKLSANAVTAAMILCGVAGVFMFTFASPILRLLGAFLLNMWLILDAVDGEVARGRGASSGAGIYLDVVGHFMVNPGLLWALVMANPGLSRSSAWALGTVALVVGVLSKAVESGAAEVAARMAKANVDRRYATTRGVDDVRGPVLSIDVPRVGVIALAKRLGVTDPATAVTTLTLASVLEVFLKLRHVDLITTVLLGISAGVLTASSLGRAVYMFAANAARLSR